MLFFIIISWGSISSEKFTIIYPDESYLGCAKSQLALLERYRENVIDFTHNKPIRTLIFIDDIGGVVSGYAFPTLNTIILNPYIPTPNPVFGSFSSWWRVGVIHEYTHIANMTSVKGFPKILQRLFGKIIAPNVYVPDWIAESYAVYSESRQFPFEGRLNEGFFDAYGFVCARDDKFPEVEDFTYNPYKFPYNNSFYIWGGFISRYRGEKYGEERISDWADRYASSFPLIGLELSHRAAYKKFSFDIYKELKNRMKEELKDYNFSQESEIIYSGKDFLEFLTSDGSNLYFVRGKVIKSSIYKSVSYSEILKLDPKTKAVQVILREPAISDFPIRIRNEKIFYGKRDVFISGKTLIGCHFKNDIYSFDMNTKEKKKIYSDNGTLKSFDVLWDGKLIICKQNGWRGGCIEIVDNNKREVIFNSELEVPLDVVVGGEKIAILLHNEDKGNKIFFFGGDTVKIEESYSKCGLNFIKEGLLFSSNRLGSWQAYLWKDFLYRLTNLPFCSYPVVLDRKIYFIGISPIGQTIEAVELTEGEKISTLEELPQASLPTDENLKYREGGYIYNFRNLLWDPILRYPTFYKKENEMIVRLNALGMDASATRILSWYLGVKESNLEEYEAKYIEGLRGGPFLSIELKKEINEKMINLIFSKPVFLSWQNGLQGIYLDFIASYKDSLSMINFPITFSPVFLFGDYNKKHILSPSILLESRKLWSDVERNIFDIYFKSVFFFPGLSLNFSGIMVCNVGRRGSVYLRPICGEKRDMQNGIGGRFGIDYQILSIGKGNSLIPFYLNDGWFRPFFEVINSFEWEKPIITIGTVFTIETSIFYILRLEPSIGLGYRVFERKSYLLWGIKGGFNSTKLVVGGKLCHNPRINDFFDFNIGNFEFSFEKSFNIPWNL